MNIKEILKITAVLLNRENVIGYLNGNVNSISNETLVTVNNMTSLANLVINELSTTYIPMVKIEKVNSSAGKVEHKQLSERVLKIINVYDQSMNNCSFTVTAEYLKVNKSVVNVEYEYLPSNYGLDDEIGYNEKDVSPRVLAYGVCAEFSISEGRFDEAVLWHKRYVDAVSEICLPKNTTLKQRSWV